ncbi:MAG: hypothetical protein FWE07_04570 [Turicibacter sp.]|nr:hypothetical protein [Turicibacter sp.]
MFWKKKKPKSLSLLENTSQELSREEMVLIVGGKPTEIKLSSNFPIGSSIPSFSSTAKLVGW